MFVAFSCHQSMSERYFCRLEHVPLSSRLAKVQEVCTSDLAQGTCVFSNRRERVMLIVY